MIYVDLVLSALSGYTPLLSLEQKLISAATNHVACLFKVTKSVQGFEKKLIY